MTMATCEAWESFMYREVWAITEMRDGCIYKTKSLGYYTRTENEGNWPTDKFVLVAPSKLQKPPGPHTFELRNQPE